MGDKVNNCKRLDGHQHQWPGDRKVCGDPATNWWMRERPNGRGLVARCDAHRPAGFAEGVRMSELSRPEAEVLEIMLT